MKYLVILLLVGCGKGNYITSIETQEKPISECSIIETEVVKKWSDGGWRPTEISLCTYVDGLECEIYINTVNRSEFEPHCF
jgi:hypothetical protein